MRVDAQVNDHRIIADPPLVFDDWQAVLPAEVTLMGVLVGAAAPVSWWLPESQGAAALLRQRRSAWLECERRSSTPTQLHLLGTDMPDEHAQPRIPLPKDWSESVKSAVLKIVSWARLAMAHTRSWAANGINARIRLKADRPHTTLGGRTPHEVYEGLPPANRAPRFEPRLRRPRSAPCAAPQTLVKGQPGASLELRVSFYKSRKHLPLVSLTRAV